MDNLFSTKNRYKKEVPNQDKLDKIISIGVLVRVSTDSQAIDGDSIEMQLELAKKKESDLKGIIYKSYIEEGVSAKKVRIDKRDAIQQLMQDIRDGKINYLIAYKRDRMFRNTMEYIGFIQFLADHNIELYLTATGEQQVDLEAFKFSGASKMMEVVMSMVNEMESATTSTRVSDTMLLKASRGEWSGGSLPIGYTIGEGEHRFQLINGARDIIKLVEDLYLEGMGLMSIAKYLNGGKVKNKEQLESPVYKPIRKEENTSDVWNHRNIQTILLNPIYTGHFSYESKLNPEMDRKIERNEEIEVCRTIDRQIELNKAYELRNSKVSERIPLSTNFLLSGLIYCEECGSRLVTTTTQPKKSNKKFSYYSCRNKKGYQKESCTHKTLYRKEIIEKIITDVAKDKIKNFLNPKVIELAKLKLEEDKHTYFSEAEKVKKDIKKLQVKLDNLTNLVSELDDDIELQVVYLRKQKDLLKEINEMKEFHATIQDKAVLDKEEAFDLEGFIDLAGTFGGMFDSAPIGVKKQMLNNLFSNIYVNKDGDIRMKLRVGLSDIEKVVNGGEGIESEDVVEFIETRTRGERIVMDSQTIVVNGISEFDVNINYFDEIDNIATSLSTKFIEIIDECDVLANPKNSKLHLDLLSEKQKKRIYDEDSRSERLYKQYLKYNYGFSDNLAHTAFKLGFTYNGMSLFLKGNNLTMDDFISYFYENTDIYLDTEIIEYILLNRLKKSSKRITPTRKNPFFGKIYCECCGGMYILRKVSHITRFSCSNRNKSISLCHTSVKSIKEDDILNQLRSESSNITKEELLDGISEISVSETGELSIKYSNQNKQVM